MIWKKRLALLLACAALVLCAACGAAPEPAQRDNTLIYGSGSITRINPAMDEHGEINLLLFDGLTAHDGDNRVIPALAASWERSDDGCVYTFHLRDDVLWHDGEPFTADDVKFTIEAIRAPENDSENAPDFEDVLSVEAPDAQTAVFRLETPNAAFLDELTIPILPAHLLAGEDMQTSDFFRAPVGTGPYRLAHWEDGQAITLVRNEQYFRGAPQIGRIVFKMVPDDAARALQLESGELDLAQLAPKDAQRFAGKAGFVCYDMQTSDYRGILFNFNNPYWQENRDLIPAVCCAVDREALVETVLLGQGETAYSPLQRNEYNCDDVERWDYDPARACAILEAAGCTLGDDGFYYRDGARVGFVLNAPSGDAVRVDMARIAAQQLREAGMDVTVEIPTQVDWGGQMAYLIGWGSPFDADMHTYKVFGSGNAANYSAYSNEAVDRALIAARSTEDPVARAEAYAQFQQALAADPAFAFLCYLDADYVARSTVHGIAPDTLLGHHGVGIFWNVCSWTLEAEA